MQLNPRYGTDPLITLDSPPAAILEPVVRQRRRLAATLATLTDEQWAHPSRCDAWSTRDVIVHLDSTNTFWTFSIAQGLKGEPTQFLATFDPVASPAQMVADAGEVSPRDVLERFVTSTEALTDLLTALDDGDWSVLAESPPGHVSVSVLAHHALWDSWVHERDILIPLGIPPEVEMDEVAASLRYGAALGPAFAANNGGVDHGVLAVQVTDPDIDFIVEIGDHAAVHTGRATGADLLLTGDAVELLEALSIRAPMPQPIPAEAAWILRGVAEVFDAATD